MLRKIKIIDAGDTSLLPGTRCELNTFTDANQKAFLEGKKPAVGFPIVLGITKAALDTESFLSSASFQETTKVLTDAAVKGSIDYLHGLKENVMIGKLIPAGEAFNQLVEDEYEDFEEIYEEEENVITPVQNDEVEDEEINVIDFTDLLDD